MTDQLLSEEGERMLREMRDSGDLCCIEILSDFNYVWDVAFVRFDVKSHKRERTPYSYEDLNEAIADAYDLWKAGPSRPTQTHKPFRAGIVPFD